MNICRGWSLFPEPAKPAISAISFNFLLKNGYFGWRVDLINPPLRMENPPLATAAGGIVYKKTPLSPRPNACLADFLRRNFQQGVSPRRPTCRLEGYRIERKNGFFRKFVVL